MVKLSALEIIKEMSKSIIGLTTNQRALMELLARIDILENRIKDLELLQDK